MKAILTICSLAVIWVLVAVPLSASGASSSSPSASSMSVPELTPEQLAIEYFNRGLKYRDKAWALEQKAAGSSKSEKLLAKADKQWKNAVEAYNEALENEPSMHQALGSLGYANRKLGHYEEALRAYDRALELAPQYVEAIEYRAEAYLALNRLEEARAAYMELFNLDRSVADTLMEAMAVTLPIELVPTVEEARKLLVQPTTWSGDRIASSG